MVVGRAAEDFASAAARADVQVLSDTIDLDVARWVCDEVWPSGTGATQIQPNLLRAMVHAGGYASIAFRDGSPVGAGIGFVGRHRTPQGWHDHLHSHMVAVLEGYRDQHIGVAIKQHQRLWCLEQGLDTIVWTFDPLVRRNARLNLIKLGIDVEGFEPNFYGEMDDDINRGDPTDRLFAWWRLNSERASNAAAGKLAPVTVEQWKNSDMRVIELPADIVALRSSDPHSAEQWRFAVRRQLEQNLVEGYRIIGITTDDAYLMERPA